MEGREEMSSGGVTVVAEQGGLKSEYPPNPRQNGEDMVMASSTATGLVSMDTSMAFGPVKKKRGRPRKYGPDGSVILALTPLSLSAPGILSDKRGRGRPPGSGQKQKLEALGEGGAYSAGGNSVGGNFTPHVIPIAAGEDITTRIMSFSQQGPRAICILCANGAISSVTLRQPDSSGGTLTYEGRFEILSLSGSFMPTESGGTKSRSGGLSVSLASPDGRVVGGGVAGQLMAASPVQGVVGSKWLLHYYRPGAGLLSEAKIVATSAVNSSYGYYSLGTDGPNGVLVFVGKGELPLDADTNLTMGSSCL